MTQRAPAWHRPFRFEHVPEHVEKRYRRLYVRLPDGRTVTRRTRQDLRFAVCVKLAASWVVMGWLDDYMDAEKCHRAYVKEGFHAQLLEVRDV